MYNNNYYGYGRGYNPNPYGFNFDSDSSSVSGSPARSKKKRPFFERLWRNMQAGNIKSWRRDRDRFRELDKLDQEGRLTNPFEGMEHATLRRKFDPEFDREVLASGNGGLPEPNFSSLGRRYYPSSYNLNFSRVYPRVVIYNFSSEDDPIAEKMTRYTDGSAIPAVKARIRERRHLGVSPIDRNIKFPRSAEFGSDDYQGVVKDAFRQAGGNAKAAHEILSGKRRAQKNLADAHRELLRLYVS